MLPLLLRSKATRTVVTPPVGWTWSLPFDIWQVGRHFFPDPTFNLRTYANVSVTKTYWVKMASEGGNDASSGADEANALATISTAILKADVDRIMVKAGTYNGTAGMNAWVPARDIEIIAYGGQVEIPFDITGLVFAAVDSHYEAARPTGIQVVYDSSTPDAYGDYIPLVHKASIAEVDATPGSWFWGLDVLSVHTLDSRAPDADIHCNYSARSFNGVHNTAKTYYIEGLSFYGTIIPFVTDSVSPDNKLYLKNCNFKYGYNVEQVQSGLSLNGGGEVIAEKCVFARCAQDGVHIALKVAQSPNLALINCVSRSHGLDPNAANNSNGLSRHGPGNTIGINCEFYNTYGPNVLDVNDGTYTRLLGCHGHDSIGTAFRSNFGIANTSFMWLDTCKCSGLAVDGQLYASVGATLYYRNMIPATPTKRELTGGTVVPY